MKKLGLYVHIPFCIRKCKYCGFVSFDNCMEADWQAYFCALEKEIELRAAEYADYEVDTIFIGGGTPTIVPAEWISGILTKIKNKFNNTVNQEITIESNPGTLTPEKLEIYRKAGINRLSIGVQSLDDTVLSAIGRIHDRQAVLETFREARCAGFDNINLDLMFSLPKQTDEIWEATLNEAVSLRPEHISFYSLQIEEGTEFYDMYKNGTLDIADDETDRARYHTAVRILKDAGYKHYEISNAALPGRESQHNLKYWSLDEYLGLGLAAHSFAGGRRFYNTSDLNEYVSALAPAEGSEADTDGAFVENENISVNMSETGDDSDKIQEESVTKCSGKDCSREEAQDLLRAAKENIFDVFGKNDCSKKELPKVCADGNGTAFKKYIEDVVTEDEVCTQDDLIFEFVFTGLRKTEGISLDDFRDKFGVSFAEYYAEMLPYIKEQIASGFMFIKESSIEEGEAPGKRSDDIESLTKCVNTEFTSGYLGLTLKGIDISNSIMAEFS